MSASSISQLRQSTAMELRLQDEMMVLKRKLNQCENESKKDKAVMDQQVELLNLRLEECKKREENLKKMNETIICSLSDFSHNGGNSKILKEIQANLEQHNNELIEGRGRMLQKIVGLECENKELVSEVTRLKLEMKDMEIALEKERINNERAIEVSYLDRTHIQNDMTKQHLINEEEFQQTRFAYEAKIQEITFSNDQLLTKIKDQYEAQIKLISEDFQKEKSILEQRVHKNSNTIKKYQAHIEQSSSSQNNSLNLSRDGSMLKETLNENEQQLKLDLVRLTQDKKKLSTELCANVQSLSMKEEKIRELVEINTLLTRDNQDLKTQLAFSEKVVVQLASVQQEQDQINQQSLQRASKNINQTPSSQGLILNGVGRSVQQTTNQSVLNEKQTANQKSSEQLLQRSLQNNKMVAIKQRLSSISSNGVSENQELPTEGENQGIFQENHRYLEKMSSICQEQSNYNHFNRKYVTSENQHDKDYESSDQDHQQSQHNSEQDSDQRRSFEEDNSHSDFQYAQPNNVYVQLQKRFSNNDEGEYADINGQSNHEDIEYYDHSLIQQQQQQEQELQSQQYPGFFTSEQQDQGDVYSQNPFKMVTSKLSLTEQNDAFKRASKQQMFSGICESEVRNSIAQGGSFNEEVDLRASVLNNNYEDIQDGSHRQLRNITNTTQKAYQRQQLGGSMTSKNQQELSASASSYKTLLLCEYCEQCFLPNDIVDHMTACEVAPVQRHHMQQQQQQQQQNNGHHLDQSQIFYQEISQLNNEKNIVEQKLAVLENHLATSRNANGAVAADRDRLRQQLDHILVILEKTKMEHVVKSEEAESSNGALKHEITFLIKKLLKAKGSLAENSHSIIINPTISASKANDQHNVSTLSSSSYTSSASKMNNRKDYSTFSIKGCVDFNTYGNQNHGHQTTLQMLDQSQLLQEQKAQEQSMMRNARNQEHLQQSKISRNTRNSSHNQNAYF